MTSTTTGRFIASLRLAAVSVVLAAGIAGFATAAPGADAGSVQLDLAVTSAHAH
jgi:hypothetical protein